MTASSQQAIEEWNSLVKREEHAAYRIQAPCNSTSPTSLPIENSKVQAPNMTAVRYCPAELREEICSWCYRVIDYCDIDRDVVGFAMFYFDRYLSVNESMNETLIQLVAMTSLYLSIKVHSTKKVSVSSMSSLSKGCFRDDQILKMEMCIIKTLNWHLNPPTPFIYLNIISPLFDDSAIEAGPSTDPIELSRYLIELSMCDGYFMDKHPSCVAYAAITVAMDVLSISKGSLFNLELEYSPEVTEFCIQRLRKIYNLALPELEEDGMAPSRGSSPATVFLELS